MQSNLIAELAWRGMIQDIMPGTEEQLLKEMTTLYVGFDPTADSLAYWEFGADYFIGTCT
jgi:tyrosyl-tRNA synthetase